MSAQQKPLLIAVSGLSGSGKSTLSHALYETLQSKSGHNVEWICADLVRKELWGLRDMYEKLPGEAYSEPHNGRAEREMNRRIEGAFAEDGIVIADNICSSEQSRLDIELLAVKNDTDFIGFWLDVPAQIMKARAYTRQNDISDADASVVDLQLKFSLGVILWDKIDGTQTPDQVFQQAKAMLQSQNLWPSPENNSSLPAFTSDPACTVLIQ